MNTSCEVRFGLFDVTAKDDAAPTSSGGAPWVVLSQIHDEEQQIGAWATLEPNSWVLDGSRGILQDTLSAVFLGFWSQALSGDDCGFTEPPWVDVTFSEPHSSLGLTLTFSAATGGWASDVNIKWYGAGGVLLKEQNYAPDAPVFLCDGPVVDYYRITLTFLSTNLPRRYLKLTGLQYGVLKIFSGDALLSARLVEEIDPVSDQLRVNTLDFSAYDQGFRLLDMSGSYVMFQQRQQVELICTVDGAQSYFGTYYLKEPVSSDAQVDMSCTDLLGVMDGTEYLGGLWVNGIAAGELVADIMTSAGAQNLYQLDDALTDVTLTGYLPICTHREAIQQVAFALGAIVSCARSEALRIFLAPSAVQHTITPADKATGHTLKQTELVTGVEVYAFRYSLNTMDTTELFREYCAAGTKTVRFSSIAYASSLSCSGAVITSSGPNYATISVQSAGNVTISGYVYEEYKSLAGSVYAQSLPANAKENVKIIESCTLQADPQALAQHIYDWYRKRITDEGRLFPGAWAPGQLVRETMLTGEALCGMLTSLTTELTDGMIGKATIVGSAEELT